MTSSSPVPKIRGAVILAAGRASRLHSPIPKALVPVGDEPLVGRLCRQLIERGLEVVVVTGHRAEELEAALARPGVRFAHNELYAESELGWSCGVGLAAAATHIGGEGALVALGDTVAEDALFDRLLASEGALNLAWLDIPVDEEAMKLRIEGGRPVLMGKGLTPPVAGEFSGVLTARGAGLSALRAGIAARDPRVDLCLGALNELLVSGLDCRAVDCSGLDWIEIDFPDDVRRMREIF